MNIENLTREEKVNLIIQLEKSVGWFPVVTLDVEDLRERFTDQGEDVPPDWVLHRACEYVYRKNCEESTHLIDWAQEIATEILETAK